MHGSKLGLPGNMAYVGKRPTWAPMEAKAGPLEVMTLPTSLRQDTPENYSGEGKEQDGEDVTRASSVTTSSPGEEKGMEGSGEGNNYPGGFGKVNNLDRSDVGDVKSSLGAFATVAGHTTLSHWQLVKQPTTPPQHFQEADAAEEARGEILYVHRPVDDLSSISSHRGEGGPDSGFTPVYQKHNPDRSTEEEVLTSTSEALMEVLTTSEVTTPVLLTTTDAQRTDPMTTASSTENSSTEEPSISISWVQEVKGKTGFINLQEAAATPAPSAGASQTISGVVQLTTVASNSKVGATQMESRSAVSESFVVGSRWTPFKGAGKKPEEHKDKETTDSKDTKNPFAVLVPNWAFDLIPSGM